MSQNLTAINSLEELLAVAAEQLARIFDSQVAILMPDTDGSLTLRAGQPFADEDVREEMVANWVFKHGHRAGGGTGTLHCGQGDLSAPDRLPARHWRLAGWKRLNPTASWPRTRCACWRPSAAR